MKEDLHKLYLSINPFV